MDKDGAYHVAGIEEGQPVRVSEDFFIEARKANPPQIALVRPGRGDYHASPIEEVTVAAKATDDYGLKGVTLHYSVNGGPETAVDLLDKKGEKQADGSTTLSLEDFKLVPGDLISVYATAKDANAEAHTDMMFIQADPFEREFSQSQAGGRRWRRRRWRRRQSARADLAAREGNHLRDLQAAGQTRTRRHSRPPTSPSCCPQSQATLRDQAVTLSGRLRGSRADRRSGGHRRLPEGYDRRLRGHGAGRATIAAAEVEGRHSQRAEGSAIPAARRSHFPAN